MLNNYTSNPTATINVNSVSGTLAKTLKDSFFVRFHMDSKMSQQIFSNTNPRIYEDCYTEVQIVVLQVMLCGDKEFLAEIIKKEDYDKIFNDVKIEKD